MRDDGEERTIDKLDLSMKGFFFARQIKKTANESTLAVNWVIVRLAFYEM